MFQSRVQRSERGAISGEDLVELQARLLGAFGADAAVSLAALGQALLAELPVAAYLTDGEGCIRFCNEAATQLWGRSPVIGEDRWCGSLRAARSDGTPLPPEESALAVLLRTGKSPPAGEAVAERPDGSHATFAAFPAPLRDAAGTTIGAIAILIDLTARVATEATLRESEEHYRNAIELSPQMPWTADPQGRILQFSDRWCTLTGQSHAEAIGGGWLEIVHPEDLPKIYASLQDSLERDTPHDVRFRVRTETGEHRWVHSRAYPRRNAEGAIVRWYGSTEDIHDQMLAEAEVREAEERYRLASQAAGDVVWDHDLLTDRVSWNEGLERRFGYCANPEQDLRAWWLGRIHHEDRQRVADDFAALLGGANMRWTAEYRFCRADSSYAHVLDRGALIRNDQGRLVRAIGTMFDLSERKHAEETLRLSEERFRLAATVTGLGIVDSDCRTGHEHWSSELRAILGVPDDTPSRAETYFALVHAQDRDRVSDHHRRALRGEFHDDAKGMYRIVRHGDGALRWIAAESHAMRDSEGNLVRVIFTNKDITEEKTAQDRVNWAATHDAVTGLPNRTVFQDRLEKALIHARASGEAISLLIVDLDNFKHINDRLGHQAGDTALTAFAARIAEIVPEEATLVRLGGDEFALILPGADAASAMATADALVENLHRPFQIDDRTIDLRASIGVSEFCHASEGASELVQSADLALYAAKTGGRSMVRLFEPSLRAESQRQSSMLSQARAAIDNGWIEAFYQPKIALASGALDGFEALLRWRHPGAGLQDPSTISCAFDDPELAGLLGTAMIEAVLSDMRGWLDRGAVVRTIAFNASAAEFRDAGFARRLLAQLERYRIPATMLELEITETALLDDGAGNVMAAIETLRAAGMTIALDDFGTGCSSLSHLRRFPVDAIKIDRSFVAGLADSAEDRAVVEAVLRLGKALGMKTIAEGIESQAQADFLRTHGCALAQGYLFASAMDAAAAEKLMGAKGKVRAKAMR